MHVGFHGVYSLAHDEPLIDSRTQALNAPLEVPTKLTSVRPRTQTRLVDYADAAEVVREVTKLVRSSPVTVSPQALWSRAASPDQAEVESPRVPDIDASATKSENRVSCL
jgi:hypothetical protein